MSDNDTPLRQPFSDSYAATVAVQLERIEVRLATLEKVTIELAAKQMSLDEILRRMKEDIDEGWLRDAKNNFVALDDAQRRLASEFRSHQHNAREHFDYARKSFAKLFGSTSGLRDQLQQEAILTVAWEDSVTGQVSAVNTKLQELSSTINALPAPPARWPLILWGALLATVVIIGGRLSRP